MGMSEPSYKNNPTQKTPHILKISPCEKKILKNSLQKRGVLL
jgi:hypothetical protein